MKKQQIEFIITLVGILLLLSGCGDEASVVQMDDKQTVRDADSSDLKASQKEDAKNGQKEESKYNAEQAPETTGVAEVLEKEDSGTSSQTMYVHVCGAVNQPGVYQLPAHSRVFQAIEMAGGFTGEAAQDTVNLADLVWDGQQLLVLTQKEVESYPQGQIPDAAAGDNPNMQARVQKSRININTADVNQLCELTGIGESKALGIIQFREENGQFKAIEELKNVSGIGDKTYEKIKDQITVG